MIVVVVAERSGGGYIGVGLVVVDRVLEVVSGSLDLVFDPGPGALGGPLGPGLLEKVLDDSVGGPFSLVGTKLAQGSKFHTRGGLSWSVSLAVAPS